MSISRLVAFSLLATATVCAQPLAPSQARVNNAGTQFTVACPGGESVAISSALKMSDANKAQIPGGACVALRAAMQKAMAEQSGACFTMRAYRFKREDWQSEAFKLESYSTCQSAARFQSRNVETPDR